MTLLQKPEYCIIHDILRIVTASQSIIGKTHQIIEVLLDYLACGIASFLS